MDRALYAGRFQQPKRSAPYQLSHLLFADDMLIFCKANKSSMQELNNLLDILQWNAGLQINKSKSKMYVSKGTKHIELLANITGIPIGHLPTKYLGSPLGHKYPRARDFGPLVNKFRSNVEGWMSKLLSFAGRVELVRSVLKRLPMLLGPIF